MDCLHIINLITVPTLTYFWDILPFLELLSIGNPNQLAILVGPNMIGLVNTNQINITKIQTETRTIVSITILIQGTTVTL